MPYFLYEKMESIGILKVNRPEVLNALNRKVLEELLVFLVLVAKEQQLRALILTGEGDKAFIAGADIKEMAGMDPLQMKQFCELGQQVAFALENASFLTIAAVNGYALGGGLEMALACDFIYASKAAKLGLPEVSLGIIPGFGGTQRLSRAVGTRLAKEMIMSAKSITAEEAQKIGLVNHVSEPQDLIKDCIEVAKSVIRHPFVATSQAKQAINWGYALSLPEALELEKNMCAVSFGTSERAQRMQAFVDKNKKEDHVSS
jgi:enoyl-CoA hydratase